jgi:hypothetical protein
MLADKANNESLELELRSEAVYQLFRQFVTPGMQLGQLADMLSRPNWLREEQIILERAFFGWVPVRLRDADSVYSFDVFPEVRRDKSPIFIRISGKPDEGEVRQLITSGECSKQGVREARIVELGWGGLGKETWVMLSD